MRHLNQNELTLVYFGEAAADSKQHAASCEICRAEYEALAEFLDSVRAAPVPEPGPYLEPRLWAAIAPRVAQSLAPQRRFPFPRWMLAPAVAALLAIAFFAGTVVQHQADAGHAFSARSRERVLLIALGDHLDRSQIVLAELMNSPEGRSTDISAEQQLAGDLVGENRLLRQTEARKGDAASAAVLTELERVLIEIAHSPAEASPAELDRLRQSIEAQGLLFKVRVVSTNVREKGMKL